MSGRLAANAARAERLPFRICQRLLSAPADGHFPDLPTATFRACRRLLSGPVDGHFRTCQRLLSGPADGHFPLMVSLSNQERNWCLAVVAVAVGDGQAAVAAEGSGADFYTGGRLAALVF